jgi:RNA polymerase sigma factor for flagellar operon FliA
MRGRRVSKLRLPSAASGKEQLMLDHLFLVRPIAASIRARIPIHVESEDLVHDGICGLVDAAGRYDVSRNVLFAVYAKHRIRGAILDGLRRLDPASRGLRAKAKRIEVATRDLGNRLGRFPTTTEVVAETGIAIHYWNQLAAGQGPMGFAHDRGEKSGDSPANLRVDEYSDTEATVAREELRSALWAAMESLPRRDRLIVTLYHWRGDTMREIGRLLSINESRVSQIHKRALERMAAVLRASGITSSSEILLR